MDIYNNKNAIKLLLFLFAATIGIGTLIYTESFLKELRAEEIKKAKIYVEATNLAQSTTDDETLNLVIKIIEGNNTIPVIVVNEEGEVVKMWTSDTIIVGTRDRQSVIDGAGGYQAYDEAIRTSAEAALAQDDDMHSSMDDAEADAAVRLATGDEE